MKETINIVIEENGEAIRAISARIAVGSPIETEGSYKGGRSYPETRERATETKRGSWSFFLTLRSLSAHPHADSLSQELPRSVWHPM